MSHPTATPFSPSTGQTYFAPNDAYEAQGFDAQDEADYLAWCDANAGEVTDAELEADYQDRMREIRMEGLIGAARQSTTPVLEAVAELSDESMTSILGVPPSDVDAYRAAVRDELAARVTVAA